MIKRQGWSKTSWHLRQNTKCYPHTWAYTSICSLEKEEGQRNERERGREDQHQI